MTVWRRNVSTKVQIVHSWPDNYEVDIGDWIRADLVANIPEFSTFSEEVDLESFSFQVERRDIHGNVVRILQDVIPSSGQNIKATDGRPQYSIIIPVYGKHEYLRMCLDGLTKTAPAGTEVVVVDDKPDEPVQHLPEYVKVVRNPQTLGFAGACNAGAGEANGRQLVFLNSDTVPRGDWLQQMRTTARRMMAGVVGARLLYPQSEKSQHAGMYLSRKDGVFNHEHKNLHKDQVGNDKHLHAVSGACMMVERRAWEKLSGFSTEYGKGYFEDVDLCLRWIEMGGRVAYCGSTDLLHYESMSMSQSKQKWLKQLGLAADVFRKKWPLDRIDRTVVNSPDLPRVDIVVPIHNALRQAVNCLNSVIERTPDWIDWTVWVVDDASDEFTQEVLLDMCRTYKRFKYVRNDTNQGYLPSIQKVTKASDAPWLVYLNSDVIVTDGWLAKMLNAAESDSKIAMVNPYTNNAANLSTAMPPGCSYLETNERVDRCSEQRRMNIVTPVGFCILINRNALEACGGWDVEYYGRGYGEETDLFMRFTEAGFRSVMADDCYVLHEGGGTFWQFGEKQQFENAGYQKFMARWQHKIQPMLSVYNKQTPHKYILPNVYGAEHIRKRRVVFLFHEVTLCGGVLAVVHICNQLIELGWDATFACTKIQQNTMDKLGARFAPLVYAGHGQMIASLRKSLNDADVVATIWVTAKDVLNVCNERPDLRPAYFIQDVEYLFKFPSGVAYSSKEEVAATYEAIGRQVINSDWVQQTVSEHVGHPCGHKIGIGVDPLMFYPRERAQDRVRVFSHCRPSTPRRGWDFLAQVFMQLKIRFGDYVETVVYDQDPGQTPVDRKLGQLSPARLAKEMGSMDIILEGSRFQGWGMVSLEAMASGCAVISTDNMGIDNFGTDEHDCLIVSYGDVQGMKKAVERLVENRDEMSRLQKNARKTSELFDWKYIGGAWSKWLMETAK